MPDDNAMKAGGLVPLTVDIVSAFVSNNQLSSEELPALITRIFGALSESQQPKVKETPIFTPAITVKKSLASADTIVSMIDGKSYASLKRHLSANGLTPEQYRTRYDLPSSYPMIAPGYSERRRAIATRLGLGRKKVDGAIEAAADAVAEELEPDAPILAVDAASKPKRGRKPRAAVVPIANTVAPEEAGGGAAVEATEPSAGDTSLDNNNAELVNGPTARPKRGRPRKVQAEDDASADTAETSSED